jgi:hypothetical protein
MSISSVSMILDRVSVATPESRIAVFVTPAGLDSIPADTIGGRERMWKQHLDLIGVWDRTSNQQEILAALEPYRPSDRIKRGQKVNHGPVNVSPLKFTEGSCEQ